MKIMIDAGHGGHDPGAASGGLREKDINLRLALRIGELLAAYSAVDVLYTRTTDVFVELSARARRANEAGVDYFLSVHINAGGGTGFESFTYPGNTDAYGGVIHRHIAAAFAAHRLPDRGRKQANLAVLRETRMPAILLEFGFIDRPADAALLASPDGIEQLARATAAGVAEAFGLTAPTEEEGEDNMPLKLEHDWQWKMLGDALDGLYRKSVSGEISPPVITDYTWAEKAYKRELSAAELAWLCTIILARQNGVTV